MMHIKLQQLHKITKPYSRLHYSSSHVMSISCPKLCRLTREGFDYQTGVNYLGHVELARILIEGLLLQQVLPY